MQRPIKKVIDPPSLLQASDFLANFMISTLVALIARLEVAEKALSEVKAAQLGAYRSLAEEKTAQQIADQSHRAFEEAKTTLT
jgi:hypothetical protein